jgi:sensor histidine kinase YesM
MFFRSFLNTERSFPLQDKYSKLLVIFCMAGISLMIAGLRYEASVFSTFVAAAVGLFILYTAILAVRMSTKQAKYFLVGWCAMLFGLIVFALRVWGIVPNNDVTLYIVLLSSNVEAVLLSAALVDRVRALREEKENAMLLFKTAEETSISNESAFLQAQIKPHFLYNALNVIATLCRLDAEKARELLLDLSNYMRHSFDFKNLEKYIAFEEELEFIQAYVRIEQARFKDKLKVEYELEDTEELRLPPLILQPLVENAIRHGIRKSDGGGTVALRVKNLAESFLIEVEDDGAGMTEEQREKIMSENGAISVGVGLVNIQRRLRRLYGTQLAIHSQPGKGTKVTIILPKGKEMVYEGSNS